MARFVTQISKTGPLFEHDPEKTWGENVHAWLDAIASEGEADLRARASAHRKTGAFEAGIRGRVESIHGKTWYRNAVISETHVYPWGSHVGATISRREAGGARADRRGENRGQAEYRGGKLEARYHMFAATARALRASRAVNRVELLKGIA